MKFSALLLTAIVLFPVAEGVFANPIDEEFKEPLGLNWQMKLADVKRVLPGGTEGAPAGGRGSYYSLETDDSLRRLLGFKKQYLGGDIALVIFKFQDNGHLGEIVVGIVDDKSRQAIGPELSRRLGGRGNRFEKDLGFGSSYHEVWESANFRIEMYVAVDDFGGGSYSLQISPK